MCTPQALRRSATARYLPLGDLRILNPGHAFAEEYRRQLLLDSGLSRVSYTLDGIGYTRAAFSSAADQVMGVRMEADAPGRIDTYLSLEGRTNPRREDDGRWAVAAEGDDVLVLSGITPSFEASEERLRYEGRIMAIPDGGEMAVIHEDNLPQVRITGADVVTLLISAATGFKRYDDISTDPARRNWNVLEAAAAKPYERLLSDHTADFRALFERVSLSLSDAPVADVPIDERFAAFAQGEDPDFAALFFQFGRYLMISSSRPGRRPANLQGIWTRDMNPAWNGGYTTTSTSR